MRAQDLNWGSRNGTEEVNTRASEKARAWTFCGISEALVSICIGAIA